MMEGGREEMGRRGARENLFHTWEICIPCNDNVIVSFLDKVCVGSPILEVCEVKVQRWRQLSL